MHVLDENVPLLVEENFLLMVDAKKTENYSISDRREGFNFDQMVLIMEELAKLHATSWAYKQSRGISKMSSKYPFLIDTLADQSTGELDVTHPIVDAMKIVIVPSIEIMKGGFAEGKESEIFKSVQKMCGDVDKAVRKAFAFVRPDGIDEVEVESWLRVPPQPIPNYDTRNYQIKLFYYLTMVLMDFMVPCPFELILA